MANAILSTSELVKHYRGRRVVDQVSITVHEGEIVGLLGPNGAGKTTSFRMVVGMVRPDGGTVTFQGRDVTRMAMYRRARLGLGYLSQEASVFRRMSVFDNVACVLEARGVPRQQRRDRTGELLADLQLTHLGSSLGETLSGGERRRLEIARSLATDPKLLLLDEPFAGVDPISVLDIQRIIKHLVSRGIGVLITDHNVRETLRITDRAYIVHDGGIFRSGTPDSLAADDEVRRIYLGTDFRLD